MEVMMRIFKIYFSGLLCLVILATLSVNAYSETIIDKNIFTDRPGIKSERPFLLKEGRAMPWLSLLLFDDKGQINGIVSGTTVIAVADNEIVSSYGTSGKTPNVDRDGNGTAESFTFKLANIPTGKDIYVYLITRGEIFPLYFANNGTGIPDINVFSLAFGTNVTLGYIDTKNNAHAGKAIPENNPIDNPKVFPKTEDTDLPTSLNQPSTQSLTLSKLLSKGIDALPDGWGLRAKTYFEAANALAGSNISNDADTARFFYALSRVAALGFNTYTDGNPTNGLNTLGDILDGFGTPNEDTKRSNLEAFSFPDPLPVNSPTGSDLQNFLVSVALPEIAAAIVNLDSVSVDFEKQWIEPFDHETVESDYGDVIFFRSVFYDALAAIYIQSAYNLNDDIDETKNNDKTVEQFLTDRPNFLTLLPSYASNLNQAKSYTNTALDDLDTAIVWMDQTETDDQSNDFVKLTELTPAQIVRARADIADAKKSLNEPTSVNGNKDPADAFILDASIFFSGLDFRNPNLIPAFTGNEVSGLFPDASFKGIFGEGIDLNEDIDPADGIPDILQ